MFLMLWCVCLSFVAVSDSPNNDDELRSESAGMFATSVTSCLPSETLAADEVQNSVLTLSHVSLPPLVSSASHQSTIHRVTTTASGPAPSENVSVGCTEVTLNTSVSLAVTELCSKVVQQPVVAQTDMSLLRSEATQVQQSSSGVDRSFCADRQTSSPEIDVLPVVKRRKFASEHDSAASSAGFADRLQSTRSGVCSDDDASTLEPGVSRSSVYRCGSPGLDEDGEFSRHKPKPVSGAVVHSQSNTAGGVKLIPLSQVMSTSISSDAAAERPSVKISHVDQVSVEATDNKPFNNQKLSRSFRTSHEQAESVQMLEAVRRRSTRL